MTMGAHNRSSSRWAPGRVERKLSKVSVHERFDVSNFNNDIAILELDKEVDIDTEAGLTRTVCLPAGGKRRQRTDGCSPSRRLACRTRPYASAHSNTFSALQSASTRACWAR